MTRSDPSSLTLLDIVARLGGDVAGDGRTVVRQVASLANARPGTIAFLVNERYLPELRSTGASAVILPTAMRDATQLPRIICAEPYSYFARVSSLFNPGTSAVPGIHASATVDSTASIGENVEIGPHAVIGRGARIGGGCVIGAACVIGAKVTLGADCRLHANVTIYDHCVIGQRAIVHSGAVIGADGFGIAMHEERWIKIPQIGRVVIGDDVEIGANTTIDRGAIDDTIIEDGVKLDNQIQVAHNVRIGAHTAIAACAGIAGSATIGRHCRIGGASGIAGHITIADGVEISAHTIITKSIDEPGTYTGAYPFEPNRQWRRNAAQLRHLAELADRVRALEKKHGPPERSES